MNDLAPQTNPIEPPALRKAGAAALLQADVAEGAGGRQEPLVPANCLCCGARQPAQDDFAALLRAVSPSMRRILREVANLRGLSAEDIANAVYADDPDGGPLCAAQVVRVVISQHRPKLALHGFSLTSVAGQGYVLRRFRRLPL